MQIKSSRHYLALSDRTAHTRRRFKTRPRLRPNVEPSKVVRENRRDFYARISIFKTRRVKTGVRNTRPRARYSTGSDPRLCDNSSGHQAGLMFTVKAHETLFARRCSALESNTYSEKFDFVSSQDPHKSATIGASRGLNLSGVAVREAGESTMANKVVGTICYHRYSLISYKHSP